MKAIIFDIETTGLPKIKDPPIEESRWWPYIVQISWPKSQKSFPTFLYLVMKFIVRLYLMKKKCLHYLNIKQSEID